MGLLSRLGPTFCSLLCVAAAASENLLQNPGFEEETDGQPAPWRVFVAPQAGAFGAVDTVAHTGQSSAMLHIPFPYPEDPANNWSQNVEQALAGKRLEASAHIRVRNAGEAALWVQCWRQQPLTLLHTASTATETPIEGTAEWQEVRIVLTVPQRTAFVTVRCVLRGSGTAWFDDVVLRVLDAGDEAAAPAEVRREVPDTPAPQVEPSAPATPQAAEIFERLERQLEELQRSNEALNETVEGLREQNDALTGELRQLREDLETLQERAQAGPENDRPPAAEERRTPPLVPRGTDTEQLR